ncbi:MAG: type II toxin-antitoxin system VapC family toxin [Pirellulales bacterium]
MDAALLDTDTLIELLKQKNAVVAQHAAAYLQQHAGFTFSAISRYEILRGIKEKNALVQAQRFALFSQHSTVLPITESILDQTAALWVAARRGGHPCGDADLMIAATALESGRVLVTGNTGHFAWIPGLQLTDWRQP